MSRQNINWINRELYPFPSNYFSVDGHDLHYLDEGLGENILFIHGNPTWSFMYREPIKLLRSQFRCIAPDHIGFGLSDKPEYWSYRPWDHASNLSRLLSELDVKEFHLVIHDWGGPIGLSVAHQEEFTLKSLTVLNTWTWSMNHRPDAWIFSKFLGSVVGRYLIEEWNLFSKYIMRFGVNGSNSLNQEVHDHYLNTHANGGSRRGISQFPADIINSGDWLDELWDSRHKLTDVPALINWGMKDYAFRARDLNIWESLFNDVEVHRLSEASHYVMEDAGETIAENLSNFLNV